MKKRLQLVLKFAKLHKGKFTILFSCIITTIFVASFFPYLFGRMVDEVFYTKSMDKFLSIALIYTILYLLNMLLHFILNMTWARLMTKFLFDIRRALFNAVLSAKGEKLSGLYSGDIINRMGLDTEQFMQFIHWNVFYNVGSIMTLLFSIGFIFNYSWQLAILAIVLTPISVYISRIFAKKLKVINEDMKKKKGFLTSWYFEILKGLQGIKLLNAAKNVLANYTSRLINITRLQIKTSKIEVVSERVNSGLSLITQLILYIISAVLIINDRFTLGGFTAIITYFTKCVLVFNVLNSSITAIAGNMVSIDRVADVLNMESEQYNEEKEKIDIKNGEIVFENVDFKYSNNINVLKAINLNIKAGDVVSIVGFSGAGKTTLVNLIYKLYEINNGSILIDGKNINDFNLYDLRNQIGIVHQDTYIYSASLRYNLIFSDEKTKDAMIINALKRAHMYEYFSTLPNRLDTIIGAKNTDLSGGQKQRLSIARIFIKNPRILIFDEATSSLDYESEMIIKQSWKDLCKGRTILVVAHRLSTIINSNNIAVLVDGKIKGYDSHDKLIKENDDYIKLFKEQYFTDGGGVE